MALPENLRVLVVDDNATNRDIVSAYLSARVTVCDQADSGPVALEHARGRRARRPAYQVVVLDNQMPDMSGLDVAGAVRASPLLRSCRVVMLTSTGDQLGQLRRSRRRPLPDQARPAGAVAGGRRGGLRARARGARRRRSRRRPSDAGVDARVPATRGRVLVVDDNAVNRVVMEAMLGERGSRSIPPRTAARR